MIHRFIMMCNHAKPWLRSQALVRKPLANDWRNRTVSCEFVTKSFTLDFVCRIRARTLWSLMRGWSPPGVDGTCLPIDGTTKSNLYASDGLEKPIGTKRSLAARACNNSSATFESWNNANSRTVAKLLGNRPLSSTKLAIAMIFSSELCARWCPQLARASITAISNEAFPTIVLLVMYSTKAMRVIFRPFVRESSASSGYVKNPRPRHERHAEVLSCH